MRVSRVNAARQKLFEADGAAWSGLETNRIDLIPAPIGMAAAVSMHMAVSQGHGKTKRLEARLAHDGETLSIRLSWEDPKHDDQIRDLDQFVDAAALLFPLLPDTNPLIMGEETKPVNGWLWKADQPEPFDVIARGYSTTQRRPASSSGLAASGLYRDGTWMVVFQRPLEPGSGEFIRFEPGGSAQVGVAVWDGSNAERAGQKAVTGAFLQLELDR
jgi:DMSO reductase family type II enzyme heme b subunit